MEPLDEPRASSWDVWLGLVLAIAGPVVAWFGWRGLPLEFLLILAGLWLMVTGLCWRRQFLTLLGPLFIYEIIRETRRSRYFLLRVYCYLMVFIIIMAALIWSITGTSLVLTVAEGTRMAQSIAVMLLAAHLILVTLIVPVYVGAAVTEDKERRTLEFLMATELDSKEILLGKLAVRLAIVMLMLFTGLPVLALLQLVGGLDADLVLGGFAATFAYTFGLACLALYNSVRARQTREAILRTYLVLIGYLLLSWMFSNLLIKIQSWLNPPLPWVAWTPGSGPPQATWVSYLFEYLDLIRVGSPFMINDLMREQMNLGKTPGEAFSLVIFEFIGFYAIAGLLLLCLALLAFRKVFKQEQETVPLVQKVHSERRSRSVGNHAFLWKELWFEGAGRPGRLHMLLTILIVVGSFVPIWSIENQEVAHVNSVNTHPEMARHRGNVKRDYARYAFGVSTLILSLFLLQVAVRASSSFSRERERHTLESLLACPATAADLVGAKWVGTILSIRLAWLWPVSMGVIGVLCGRVPVLAFAALFAIWLIYAGAITCLGMWYSMISLSSTRALVYTLATVGLLYTGTLALPMQYRGRQISSGMHASSREWLFRFQISMSPAFVFDRLIPAVTASGAGERPAEDWEGIMLAVSSFVWFMAGLLFWRRNVNLLRRQMCPQE